MLLSFATLSLSVLILDSSSDLSFSACSSLNLWLFHYSYFSCSLSDSFLISVLMLLVSSTSLLSVSTLLSRFLIVAESCSLFLLNISTLGWFVVMLLIWLWRVFFSFINVWFYVLTLPTSLAKLMFSARVACKSLVSESLFADSLPFSIFSLETRAFSSLSSCFYFRSTWVGVSLLVVCLVLELVLRLLLSSPLLPYTSLYFLISASKSPLCSSSSILTFSSSSIRAFEF